MKRIFITGLPASGKSRLARILHKKTGMPIIHIDRLRRDLQGVRHTKEEIIVALRAGTEQETWIVEGSFLHKYDDLLPNIDHFVIMDAKRHIRVWRAFLRIFRVHGMSRALFPREKRVFRAYWFWFKMLFRGRKRKKLYARLMKKAPDHVKCIRLNSDRDVEEFIAYAVNEFQYARDADT